MEQLIPPQTRRVTVDEYLRMEEASETKHEFRDGRIIDVAGGTFAHGDIAANLIFQLKNQFKGNTCKAVGSDVRVRITRTPHYCYPDVTVICEPPIFDPPDKQTTITNPQVIIEVSSPSTLADDRKDKFYDYISIESLKEYILVAQDEARVDTFYRHTDGIWAIGPSAVGIARR